MLSDSVLYTLSNTQVLALAAGALAAGVGISAVGPGGVLISIALFAITGMSAAMVAGTAIVSHIATGLAGTLGYARAGHFTHTSTRRAALQLSVAALVGAPLGMWINTRISRDGFGVLLAALAVMTAFMILHKQRGAHLEHDMKAYAWPGTGAILAVGLLISAVAALFGLGGPMLCVPLLVLMGTPMRASLAASQVQSVVIASVGTVAYVMHGSVDWVMAVFVMIPQVVGVLVGVKLAHTIPPRALKFALAAALIAVSPYLLLG